MMNLQELSEMQLETVCGGRHHQSHHREHHGSASTSLLNGKGLNSNVLASLSKYFSAINISVIVISNSTINGNVTFNVSQK